MKKTVSLLLAFLLLTGLFGCARAAETPAFYEYALTFNGRRYSTAGDPILLNKEMNNTLKLLGRELTEEVSESTFPAGFRFYAMERADLKKLMVCVAENGKDFLMAASIDPAAVETGRDILSALELDNDFSGVYRLLGDGKKMKRIALDAAELQNFAAAYAAAKPGAPTGEKRELLAFTYLGDVMRFTLYENGALVYAGCPEIALLLDEKTHALLWK